MGSINIQAKELPLYKVFSNDFVFKIPLYQRPYAWTIEEAEALFEDLLTALEESKEDIDDISPYFLGSIVLIKSEHKPDAQVVDGQQRLTTLTILLSVLRELSSLEKAHQLTKYIYQEADGFEVKQNQYRVTLRDTDADFFQDYIQKPQGILQLQDINILKYSESCKNIRDNAFLFRERLEKLDSDKLFRFTQFVVTRCCLVIITTTDFDSAYRIFSVMNNRGLDLSLADILKAEILGKISPEMQDKYAKKWETAEEKLGVDSFKNLFSYIRMVRFKHKPRKSIITELLKESQPNITEFPQEFIDKTLIPLSDALHDIKHQKYENNYLDAEINRIFYWLLWIDHSDWIPPAILYLSQNYHRPELLIRFFTDLDRLASGLMIYRANIDKRIARYGKLLNAIENNIDLYTSDSPLQLTPEENKDIINQLNGNIYSVTRIRLYVLVRLNDAISNPKILTYSPYPTIEHVLPQNPPQGSEWERWFPTQEQREKYLHRLGNLILLSTYKNSEAQNYDFRKKKQKYFTTKSGVSPFALTTQVLTESEWTPQIIEKRQTNAINKLKEIWRLY
ncbi:hypothetical protein NIES267_59930 [Calothrix parasitica NIES-267]|uniref:DUF262 domain-containing protein n=1 Tax=Calothrix parasitica NIES-267 TaxID=1973488 RepID=A0A1Z4LZ49_9CYAN|nr:hypothetical protein NIES267_59930 [Calothrix parasitica NIES-267]